jgi:hypothetical protein
MRTISEFVRQNWVFIGAFVVGFFVLPYLLLSSGMGPHELDPEEETSLVVTFALFGLADARWHIEKVPHSGITNLYDALRQAEKEVPDALTSYYWKWVRPHVKDGRRVLVDSWGNRLIYTNCGSISGADGKTLICLYSPGPDGEDDEMAGDDISRGLLITGPGLAEYEFLEENKCREALSGR